LHAAEKKAERNSASPMRKSLTKLERLKSQSDLKKVFASSKRASCGGAKLFYLPNPDNKRRFAVSLIRKFGNSVVRNRAKRQFREIYRLNKHRIADGWDLVFVLYPGNYEYKEREQQFASLIQRAGLQR
jgi:ribonuclease P protein component